jgi:hypothetical protein
MNKEAMNLIHEQLQKLWLLGDKAAELANPALDAMKALAEQPAQQQEPVGQLQEEAYGRGQVMWFNKPADQSMLYTSPASKPWVGLTDEEIEARAINFYNPEMYKRAVLWAQEKLKERNQ